MSMEKDELHYLNNRIRKCALTKKKENKHERTREQIKLFINSKYLLIVFLIKMICMSYILIMLSIIMTTQFKTIFHPLQIKMCWSTTRSFLIVYLF
jgi:hypothetical protein